MKRCPGCKHRDLTASQSERQKRDFVASLLPRDRVSELRAVPETARVGYRRKVTLRADLGQGDPKIGLRLRTFVSSRPVEEVIDIAECPLHSEPIRQIHRALLARLRGANSIPLVFVVLSGTLVTLVLKSVRARESVAFASDLERVLRPAGATGLFLNFNPSAGERVLSSRGWVHVWGDRFARDADGLWYGPESFRQQLGNLHRDALHEAHEFLAPSRSDHVVDLYSGTGASILRWKSAGARTIGVELGQESVDCSVKNVGNGIVLRGRAGERLPQLREWVRIEPSARRLAFVNPPRMGLEPSVVTWLAREFRPERLAYLSCSPGSLARDLSILQDSGYALRQAIPYDFFPGTHHVEVLALLALP